MHLPHLPSLRIDPPGDWIRTTAVFDGVAYVLDFLAVHTDVSGVQHAGTPQLDEVLRLHRLACGAEGPLATLEIEGVPFVLFMSPSWTRGGPQEAPKNTKAPLLH